MNKLTLILLISLILTSCKDNKENVNGTSNISSEYKINEDETLTLLLKAKIEKDDKFKFCYLNEGQEQLKGDQKVEINVKGSSEIQELEFRTSSTEIPTKLFLMFGNDEKYQSIEFESAEIQLNENTFQISKTVFFQFFNPNGYIDYDKENAVATCKAVEGEYGPWFMSRDILIDRLLLEFD
ncbi:MAG: hypothetical protein Wins2KO_04460 [Winogradskyella sp.]